MPEQKVSFSFCVEKSQEMILCMLQKRYKINYSKKMSEKKDNFSKAVQIYMARYEMNLKGLFKFINDKVDSPPDVIQLIQQSISALREGKGVFNQEELRGYLNIVAAIQAKINVKGRDPSQFKEYTKIKFKSRKAKEQGKDAPKVDKKVEEKEEPKTKEEEEVKQVKEKLPPKSPKPQNQAQKISEEQSSPSPFLKQKQQPQKLKPIEQNIIEEDRTSNVIRTSNSQEFFAKFPEAQLMKLHTTSQKQVAIRGYDKFGQNYFNPIIKYRVVFKDNSIFRRYSQFDNLMKYLNKRYQGFILPDLPPKEGIKSNLSYFRGVDEAFLNQRQEKLEDMLNTLLNSKFISEDQILINFLTNQDFEIESGESMDTLGYIRSLGQIAFNAKELKTYGMAYYNYFKSFKKEDVHTKVTECYKSAQEILQYCLQLQNFRTSVISNFDRRRQIFAELQMDQDDRTLTIKQFDKLSLAAATEVRNLDKQMNKYYELKSQESWLGYLITQKQADLDVGVEEAKRQFGEIKERIVRMEVNLIDSIDNLVRNKKVYIEDVGQLVVEWRKSIHP